MNIYEVLKSENAKTLKLLGDLEDTTAGQPDRRKQLLHIVSIQIQAQNRIEEDNLYPLLSSHPDTRQLATSVQEENRNSESILHQLRDTPPTDSRFENLVETLHAQVRKHVQKEEQELFPQAANVVTAEQAIRLAVRAEEQKPDIVKQLQS